MTEIKGFNGYYIDMDDKTVYKSFKGRLIPARTDKVRRFVTMYNREDKKQYYYYIARIMFAVMHNIDIRDIPGSTRITLDDTGTPYIVSNNICFIKKPYRSADIIDDIKEQIRLGELCLKAYQTEDYTQVLNEFYKVTPDMKKYITSRGYAINDNNINDLICDAIDEILTSLTNKRLRVSDVKVTFKYVIRRIVAKRVKIKKMIYDDYLLYLHS